MSSQQAFLEAIRDSPNDNDLRLVFADWLDEHGKGYWAAVRRLSRNPLGPDGVALMLGHACRTEAWKETFWLLLDGLAIGDEGVAWLVGRPEMACCIGLDLKRNGITAEGVRQLIDCPGLAGLKWLDLGRNPIGNAGAMALRSEEHTSELQSLRHLVCRLLLEKK